MNLFNATRSRFTLGDYVGRYVRLHAQTPALNCYCAEGVLRDVSEVGYVNIELFEPDARDGLNHYWALIESVIEIELLDEVALVESDSQWHCHCNCPQRDPFEVMLLTSR